MEEYDFSGWATRSNIKCSDGRVIMHNAFAADDNKEVPLVWNHNHNSPDNILGHGLLVNKGDGVLVYGKFNNTKSGQQAKELVKSRDIKSLSIWANDLIQRGENVVHGSIKEVSMVIAGANKGAKIENVICHGEDGEVYESEDEAIIHFANGIVFDDQNPTDTETQEPDTIAHAEPDDDKTIKEIIDSLTDEQKAAVYFLIASVAKDEKIKHSDEGGDTNDMAHYNVFEQPKDDKNSLMHSEEISAAFADIKTYGSLKESFLKHGITNLEVLFPEAKPTDTSLSYISRDMGWVDKILASVHRSPFSRVKSVFANITEDEARAKGYIKGKEKKDEVFTLLKRKTEPTTVYKHQSIDRDDLVDIVDFDMTVEIKKEMRMMLNEELARAFLIGDGRLSSSDDKINEQNIRPIWKDEDLYTIKATFEDSTDYNKRAKAFIRSIIKNRRLYKGSGNPTLYASDDIISDCLLLEDNNGRIIYDSIEKLKTALRVSDIITVPVMENLTRTDSKTSNTLTLYGIIVNMRDYNVGADKGGAVSLFDDFDIDYNKQKYLIETRCSAALVRPYSAIAVEGSTASTGGASSDVG